MGCTSPMTAYKLPFGYSDAKGRTITFTPAAAYVPGVEIIKLPCRKCYGCRLAYSKEWAVRLIHESMFHEKSCFVTLTYDNDHLPPCEGFSGGTLNPDDVTLFLKRLRKKIGEFRYFYCGEYGDKTHRAHYHLILFGEDFSFDRELYHVNRTKDYLWTSKTLENTWKCGYCPFGAVSFDSCSYVARYIIKKQIGNGADEFYGGRVPEFVRMSRMPGIGFEWIRGNYDAILSSDMVVLRNGVKAKPPKYYTRVLGAHFPDEVYKLKETRKHELVKLAEKGAFDSDLLRERAKFNEYLVKNKLLRGLD